LFHGFAHLYVGRKMNDGVWAIGKKGALDVLFGAKVALDVFRAGIDCGLVSALEVVETTTSCSSSQSISVVTLPMYPAPPETSTFIADLVIVRGVSCVPSRTATMRD
jgi:hypothetical protein